MFAKNAIFFVERLCLIIKNYFFKCLKITGENIEL